MNCRSRSASARAEGDRDMSKKILVVDDEEHQRSLYAQEFQAEGYEVIEAENGRVATPCTAPISGPRRFP